MILLEHNNFSSFVNDTNCSTVCPSSGNSLTHTNTRTKGFWRAQGLSVCMYICKCISMHTMHNPDKQNINI